jgi:preprotein translocase subunit SecE
VRWVQFSYIALALSIFYVADRIIELVWGYFAEPDSTLVTCAAALIGLISAFALYRNPRANEFTHECVGELMKVTWPTRDETYYSTVVVIVTSIIAAVYTGAFDMVWSKVTDFVYAVRL